MDENPYKATVEVQANQSPRRRRSFGYLILGAIGGTFAGGILAAFLMMLFRYEIPETPVRDAIYSYIPVTCVAGLACVGTFLGAIWERWRP